MESAKEMKLVVALLALLLAAPSPAPDEGFVVAPDGIRLHYRVEGAGRDTLVVVHGGPGNTMESIRADFGPGEAGRRVIFYDQRGNGGSTLTTDRAALAIGRHVEDLEAIRLHFGLEKMALLGNSWGGLLASYYAIAHPDRVSRLVLHDPAPPARIWLEGMTDEIKRRKASLPAADRARFDAASDPMSWYRAADPLPLCRDFMSILFRLYAYDPKAKIGFRGDACAGGPEAVRRQLLVNKLTWSNLPDYDLRPYLWRFKAPVLILYGEADPVPRAGAEAWAAGFPDARLLVLRRAGHLSHVEQPAAYFAALEAFLRGGWPPDAARVAGPGR
jgi:proline iminopeptidase